MGREQTERAPGYKGLLSKTLPSSSCDLSVTFPYPAWVRVLTHVRLTFLETNGDEDLILWIRGTGNLTTSAPLPIRSILSELIERVRVQTSEQARHA